jgi:hypothetical protein
MGVWAVVPTGFPTGFELEAQPARQPTPRQKVTANVMVFIVLIVEWTLSGIKFKLQFCFSANNGTLKMIPLLNESAYTWSKLCPCQ